MDFLYQVLIRFVYADNRAKRIIRPLLNVPDILHFATNPASACKIHHSFTSHSLISFFHNLTDCTVGNIINHFHRNQFISNGLHSPKRVILRRGVEQAVVQELGFLLPGSLCCDGFPAFFC